MDLSTFITAVFCLTDDWLKEQRPARVEPDSQNSQGRGHRDQPSQKEGYAPIYEPLHDDLSGHRAHRRTGEPAGE